MTNADMPASRSIFFPASSAAKYWAIFRTQLLNRLAYPLDLAVQSISIVLFMAVFVFLWQVTYRTTSEAGVIAGLTLSDTIWYLMLAETIVLSKPRLSRAISDAIKDGSIAYLLNKPYNFLLYQLSVGLADNLSNMVFNLLAGGVLVWLSVGPPPDPGNWPAVGVAMLLGWLIDACLNALIGLAAFATEEVSAFEWMHQKMVFILGGMLIPLDFLPLWLQRVAHSLPFAYTVYGPAHLFVKPDTLSFLILLSGQLVWLLGLGTLVMILYHKAIGWLAINGG